MRTRYDKRESRPEDLNVISDLRTVIAEQERDLAILNEEKRYFQMKLMKQNNTEELESPKISDGTYNTVRENSPNGNSSSTASDDDEEEMEQDAEEMEYEDELLEEVEEEEEEEEITDSGSDNKVVK